MSQANYQYHHSQHEHSHHEHHHHGSGNALLWPLLLTLGFALVEAAGGWYTGSLALLGDAGHMFSDSAALGLAWRFTRHPGSQPSQAQGRRIRKHMPGIP